MVHNPESKVYINQLERKLELTREIEKAQEVNLNESLTKYYSSLSNRYDTEETEKNKSICRFQHEKASMIGNAVNELNEKLIEAKGEAGIEGRIVSDEESDVEQEPSQDKHWTTKYSS